MLAYKYRYGRGIKDEQGREIFERDIDLLAQNKIFIPTPSQLNDPSEALVEDSPLRFGIDFFSRLSAKTQYVTDAYTHFKEIINKAGVNSLSKSINNELLWAYYANGHKGYAVIFDTDVLNRSMNENFSTPAMYEFDVRYARNLPIVDLSIFYDKAKDANKLLSLFLGQKSKAWKHEQEHRLLFDKGAYVMQIDYRAIHGFVFGCTMPEADMDYIMQHFQGRGLRYYRMYADTKSYSLSYKKIPDRYPNATPYEQPAIVYNKEKLLADYMHNYDSCEYKNQIEAALEQVAREPFVTSIYMVSMEKNVLRVWANIRQDGVLFRVRKFDFHLDV